MYRINFSSVFPVFISFRILERFFFCFVFAFLNYRVPLIDLVLGVQMIIMDFECNLMSLSIVAHFIITTKWIPSFSIHFNVFFFSNFLLNDDYFNLVDVRSIFRDTKRHTKKMIGNYIDGISFFFSFCLLKNKFTEFQFNFSMTNFINCFNFFFAFFASWYQEKLEKKINFNPQS